MEDGCPEVSAPSGHTKRVSGLQRWFPYRFAFLQHSRTGANPCAGARRRAARPYSGVRRSDVALLRAFPYRLSAGVALHLSMVKPFKEPDGAPEVAEKLPSDFPIPLLTTGTIDDDDDPAHERSGENEASVREKNENTDAAEEFRYNDEDRDRADQ